uniref:G_PROTEIN_RECEP_F1_2 domain-containing protein n=1 Tax=Steinernema glaseri TaxID=37863 RepID=A0A1I7Z8L5_9BILA
MSQFNPISAVNITVLVGILGIILNTVLGYALRRASTFGYAFGTICFSQVIANIGLCATFAIVTALMTAINPSWHRTYLGERSGQYVIFFWQASIWNHLLAVVNRTIMVFSPQKYHQMFSEQKVTKKAVALVWALALFQAVPHFIPPCTMVFDPTTFTYGYGSSLCAKINRYYTDALSIIVVTIIGILLVASCLRLVKLRNPCSGVPDELAAAFQLGFFLQVFILYSTGYEYIYLDLRAVHPTYGTAGIALTRPPLRGSLFPPCTRKDSREDSLAKGLLQDDRHNLQRGDTQYPSRKKVSAASRSLTKFNKINIHCYNEMLNEWNYWLF